MRRVHYSNNGYREDTVLIVNDTPEQLWLMDSLLRKAGYEVITAGDGDEAPSPSPSPGEGDADGAGSESNSPTPAPSPSGTPQKKMAGEVKGASEDQSPQDIQEGEGAEAVEDDKMSPQQAERLLRSMRAEEQQVRLDERKAARRVYNDW